MSDSPERSPSYQQLRKHIFYNVRFTDEQTTWLKTSTEEYFEGDQLATDVFNAKNAHPVNGQSWGTSLAPTQKLETPPWAWFRIAVYIASAEIDDGGTVEEAAVVAMRWFDMMCNKDFIPGGQIIRGSAHPGKVSLVNCTTVKLEDDSIEAIYKADYQIAKVESRGEGVGIDVSGLRPQGCPVNNAALTTSGAVSWMQRFDDTTDTIAQNGRRGALLISMDIEHPEAMGFIHVKSDLGLIKNANISLRLSDAFMNAYLEKAEWIFRWNRISFTRMQATDVMRELSAYSAKYAEPGIQFIDTMSRLSNSDALGYPIISTNACSEQALTHLDSCVLGHTNFATLPANKEEAIKEIKRRAYEVSWFLDNVVTKQIIDHRSPLEGSREVSWNLRRIGGGLTGLADYFAKVGIDYDSEEAIVLGEEMVEALNFAAYQRSKDAAKIKGPFPAYSAEYDTSEFMLRHPELAGPRKNVCCSTIAPVGTGRIMLLSDSNGGEPWTYLYGWRRTRVSGEYVWYFDVNKSALNTLPSYQANMIKDQLKRINATDVDDLRIIAEDEVIEILKEHFPNGVKTTENIDFMKKADLIGVLQKHIDSSISVTYNLPPTTTVEEIEALYVRCWNNGLKGVSIYRPDPENREPIFQYVRPTTFNYATSNETVSEDEVGDLVPKRPYSLLGTTVQVQADGHKFYFTLNCDDDQKLVEVFVSTNEREPKVNTQAAQDAILTALRSGEVSEAVIESQLRKSNHQAGYMRIARLISIGLRCGITVGKIVEALSTVEVPVSSYIYQLRRGLSSFFTEDSAPTTCPECGENALVLQAGCGTCSACQFSRC